MFRTVLRCTDMYSGIQKIIPVYRNVLQCTELYSGVQCTPEHCTFRYTVILRSICYVMRGELNKYTAEEMRLPVSLRDRYISLINLLFLPCLCYSFVSLDNNAYALVLYLGTFAYIDEQRKIHWKRDWYSNLYLVLFAKSDERLQILFWKQQILIH